MQPRLKPIDQQVVVVFGASSGIGRETARRFAARGARVVVSARSAEGLASLVEEILTAGGQALSVPADASKPEQVEAVAEAAVERFGRLDTWVHAAAVLLSARFEDTTPDEFRQVIEINLLGQAHGAMAAIPRLRQSGGGALILVSSVEAARPMPYHSAYAASKHGVHGFAQALRLELEHDGAPISLTEVMPASINTPLFTKGRTKLGVKPTGMPPIYPPELVAQSILHAAEHPEREIVVGGSGQVMLSGQRMSPRLMDAFLKRTAFSAQKTHEPRSPESPNNLYGPVPEYDRVEGDFTRQAGLMKPSAWLQDGAGRALGAVAAGALLTIGVGMLLEKRSA